MLEFFCLLKNRNTNHVQRGKLAHGKKNSMLKKIMDFFFICPLPSVKSKISRSETAWLTQVWLVISYHSDGDVIPPIFFLNKLPVQLISLWDFTLFCQLLSISPATATAGRKIPLRFVKIHLQRILWAYKWHFHWFNFRSAHIFYPKHYAHFWFFLSPKCHWFNFYFFFIVLPGQGREGWAQSPISISPPKKKFSGSWRGERF